MIRKPALLPSLDKGPPNLADPLECVIPCHSATFRKLALLPSSGKEAPDLVDSLECVTGLRFGSRFCFRLLPENTQLTGPFISSYSQSLNTAETLRLLRYAPENRSRPWIVRGKQLQKN